MDKKILFVTADKQAKEALVEKCKGHPYACLISPDTLQAVKLAHKEKPDVIIIDEGVPGGGQNLVADLKSSSITQAVPLFLVTDKQIQPKIKVDLVIAKPWDLDQLISKVRQFTAEQEQLLKNNPTDVSNEEAVLDLYEKLQQEKDLDNNIAQREEKMIIIVDDEIDAMKPIVFRLQKVGYKVIVEEDGKAGLNKIRTIKPDLIILDLLLPKLNGYEVSRLVKFDKNLKHIPIIMCTARVTEEDKSLGLEVGADIYITKPFEPEELLDKVEQLLGS